MKHAILGLLIERRGYGRDLWTRLDERLGPGFAVPEGTVYASLGALDKAELIHEVRRVNRGNQVRVYFDATPAGVEEFATWMEKAPEREPMRGELYLKIAMAEPPHLSSLRKLFEELELACLAEMTRHTRSKRLADELADPVPWATVSRWVLDAAALERLNGDLRWVKMVLELLRAAELEGTVPRAALLKAVESI